MRVICCRCRKEYPMGDNLFDVEKTNRPILKCPHCGFEHLVDFIPLDKKVETPERKKIESIDLGPYYTLLYATRIADKDRVDQSGSDDGHVTDWDKADEFILCTDFKTGSKGVTGGAFKLEWREVVAGSFADVGSTGEIHFTTTTTVLSDNTDVVVGERKCSTFGDTWVNGLESENDNISPDTGV